MFFPINYLNINVNLPDQTFTI